MKSNQKWYGSLLASIACSVLLLVGESTKAASSLGGAAVAIGGLYWTDVNHTNYFSVGCGPVDAYGSAQMVPCQINDPLICGTVTATKSGSGLKYTEVFSDGCGYKKYRIEIDDPKQHGEVKITASVEGDGPPGPTCPHYNFKAVGVAVYDPDESGCQTCGSGSSSDIGRAPVQNDSVNIRFRLGKSSVLMNAGFIWLYADTPSTNLAKSNLLVPELYGDSAELITNVDGSISQVKAPQGLVNVRTIDDYHYQIEYFYTTNVTGLMTNGLYGTNGPAFDTWVVQNPDTNASFSRIWITEQPESGVNRLFKYSYNSTNLQWDLTEPDGHTTVSTWKIADLVDGAITNYYRQVSSGTNVVSYNCKRYEYVAGADLKLLLEEVIGYGASALTNAYTYYTNGPASNLLQKVEYATGNWEFNIYDNYGRVTTNYSAYNNSAPPSSGEPDPLVDHCKKTTHVYDSAVIDTNTIENPFVSCSTKVEIPVDTGSGWELHLASLQYYTEVPGDYSDLIRYPNDRDIDSHYLETYTEYASSTSWGLADAPAAVHHPDGSTTTYYYPDEFTTWVYDPDNSWTTAVTDEYGNPLSVTKVDLNTWVSLSQSTYCYTNSSGVYFDESRRDHDVTDLAGRVTQFRYSDCCGSYTVTDPDGNVTQYTDDLLKRPVATTTYYGGAEGITRTNTLDGAGRVLVSGRIGTNGTAITLQQSQYDLLGNAIRQTNALGGVTITTNVVINHQLYITNTYPDGGTRIETYYRDGRLQSVTGTAVHPIEYIYGIEEDTDGNWREYSQEIKLTATGGTNEWTKTYVDGIGRNYKTVYSAPSAPYPTSESLYNNAGQLWKQVDADGVTTLYIYHSYDSTPNAGQIEYTITGLSSTARGLTDYGSLVSSLGSLESGIDRIQRASHSVVAAAGGLPDLTQIDLYVWTNGETDGDGTLINVQQTTTTGLTNWNISYGGADTSITKTVIVSPGSSRTELAINADDSYTINLYSYGRLASSTRYDSSGTSIGSTTYGYDPQGRQYQITDARNGTTTYGFNDGDLVTSVTSPNPGTPGGSSQTTTTYYNTMLQATNVVQPDGTSVTSAYLLTGELGSQSGSRTYPVAYSYDYAGRMQTMTNWSGFPSTGARVTTWKYDGYRGFLTNKVYDGGTAGPSYTYTSAGRLQTRKWARGITTTYAYDPAGGLTNINYSDGTPAVTNSYDRLGRMSLAVVNGMSDTMTYNLANELLTESFTGGPLNGLSVTNGYDQFLRRTNLTSLATGVLNQVAYGYDAGSRLSTVSDGTNNANYSYVANSTLVSQITFKSNTVTRMTTTKQYDYLNRLTSISSTASNTVSFNYTYDGANQRVRDTLADGSYWVYTYDSLGQVTGGTKYWSDGTPVAGQQFDYIFDTIGNRTKTLSGGDHNGGFLRAANYYANNLNQITNRDVPGYVDVKGVSFATNTVTVNGQTAYRKSEYFRDELAVNNSSAALWTNIITAATGQTSVTGNVYVAKQPEVFSYDADGNLTNDGRFSYAWDGENRLTNLTSLASAPTGSKVKLDFVYDSKSRRIQKLVSTNNGSIYVAQSTNKFLYDGWNLAAEVKPGNALLRSYVWGSDLSGSMQGAGGVGGLLEVSYYGGPTTNCFLAVDGNGNVMMLVNAADGTLAANYEYGPFGEVIRSTGSMAQNNAFRFSTKYDDDESDLLYYGYRYYKPSTGTWPNRDPMEEEGGINLYVFAENKPTGEIDIFGLCRTITGSGELLSGNEIDIPLGLFAEADATISLEFDYTGKTCDCCGRSKAIKTEATFALNGGAEVGITFGKRFNKDLRFASIMGFLGLRVAGRGGVEGSGTFRTFCDGSREAEGQATITASIIGQGGAMAEAALPRGWPFHLTGPPWGQRIGVGIMAEATGTMSAGLDILCKDDKCKWSAQETFGLTVDAKAQLWKTSFGWRFYDGSVTAQQLDWMETGNPFPN